MNRTIGSVAIATLLLLVATSCAGGLSDEQKATVSAAEANARSLQLTDDFTTSQVLNGRTGEITSLGDVVAGDRPVLMWYWAPN